MNYLNQFLGGDSVYAAAVIFACLVIGGVAWLARALEKSWDLEAGQ